MRIFGFRRWIVPVPALAAFLCGAATLSARDDTAKISVDGVRVPIYQGDSSVPVVILDAEHARPVGTRFELKGVRLQWLGDSVADVRGVVTTPTAVYDRATKKITGDEWIKYRSAPMDLDGVGFDIDQVRQIIHIRTRVKVVLKGKLETIRQQQAEKGSKGKLKIKPETIAKLATVTGLARRKSESAGGKSGSAETASQGKTDGNGMKLSVSSILWIAFGVALAVFLVAVAVSHARERRRGKGGNRITYRSPKP